MSTKNEILQTEQSITQAENEKGAGAVKKPFVEPEVSVPVDVLEATTFFQVASSGVTN